MGAGLRTAGFVFSGIAHVELPMPAGEEGRARAFYGGVLALEEIPKPPLLAPRGGCWFRCGAHELHLSVDPDVVRGKQHPALLVEGLDALSTRLRAAGAHVEPDDRLPGYRRFYSFDPFGNRLEFLEPRETTEGSVAIW